jgi:hypothetical protein
MTVMPTDRPRTRGRLPAVALIGEPVVVGRGEGAQRAHRGRVTASGDGAELGDGTTIDRHDDPLAGLGTTEHLAHVVAEFALRDRRHGGTVADVLRRSAGRLKSAEATADGTP